MAVLNVDDLAELDQEFALTGFVPVDEFPRVQLAVKSFLAALPLIIVGAVGAAFLVSEHMLLAVAALVAGLIFFAAEFRLSAARWFLGRYMRSITRPQFNADRRRATNISPGDWMMVDEDKAARVAFIEHENSQVSVTLTSGSVRVLGSQDRAVVGLLIPNVMSPSERSVAQEPAA